MDVAQFKTGDEYRAWLKRNQSRVKIINVARGADESYAVTYATRMSDGARVAVIAAFLVWPRSLRWLFGA
jgi:hypothetical protein